jgi:hypothetical protein
MSICSGGLSLIAVLFCAFASPLVACTNRLHFFLREKTADVSADEKFGRRRKMF